MTTISAPKKASNFPFTGVLLDSMTFWVADANAGVNYQLTPNVLFQYLKTALLPVQSSDVVVVSTEVTANTTIGASYDGKTIYSNSNTDLYLTFANTLSDDFNVNLVNLSTANVHIDYNGFQALNAPTVIGATWVSLVKVANTFVGK